MFDNRKHHILAAIVSVSVVFLMKLFAIQVYSDEYKTKSENNTIKRTVRYPYRGLIYDRNGELIVFNEPVFQLEVTPQNVGSLDTTAFCELLGMTKEEFENKMNKAKNHSYVKPSIFIDKISNTEFARIQDQLVNFAGFDVVAKTNRAYTQPVLANALGYVAEINQHQLTHDSTGYYNPGDHIGISGLEEKYEEILRGKRGVSYNLVNVYGVEKGAFEDGAYDTLAVAGQDIETTIDIDLQAYAETLMLNKRGSIVALEPKTGEVLCFVSAPSYDPNLLSGGGFSENYLTLAADSARPLFNRPIMAMYPPGSIFKTVQSLIGLQEGVVSPEMEFYSGDLAFGEHVEPGYYNMEEALLESSNHYFYKAFRAVINQEASESTFEDTRIGIDKWNTYVKSFGFGRKLGIDLPNESAGFVPGSSYYDNIYGKGRWKYSTIYSLSIGQGELLVTPLQMVNLAAIIANEGYYYTPHLFKSAKDTSIDLFTEKNQVKINRAHFQIVQDAMEKAVEGTAERAVIDDIAICGKTGTAENPHGEDHSVFMAFAPKEDPKIAIAVYVENVGWGGRAAASTASLLIEKYLKGCIENDRLALQDYVLKGDFSY